MNMKIISLLLVLVLLVGITGCTAKNQDNESNVTTGSGIEENETITGGEITEKDAIQGNGDVEPEHNPPSIEVPPIIENPSQLNPELNGSLESIMDSIYAGQPDGPNTAITNISLENEEYFLGNIGLPIKQGIGSEPMMSSIAHSIVLIEVNEGSNVKEVKAKIKANVDGRKWICVGVEPENILVENIGNLVILVMSENAQNYIDNFLKLGK